MPRERSKFPTLSKRWERRTGVWLCKLARAFGPVKQMSLFLGDPSEARPAPATSDRGWVWSFKPHPGVCRAATGIWHGAFIGFEVHRDAFTICCPAVDGSEAFEHGRFCRRGEAAEVAVAGERRPWPRWRRESALQGHAAGLWEEIRPCMGGTMVVNLRQFPVTGKSVKKTDRNDAPAAAIFLSGIGDVNDCADAGKLEACVGILPRGAASDGVERRGRFPNNRPVRRALVQGVLCAIRCSGNLSAMHRCIQAQRGSGQAIIASARLRLAAIHTRSKNKWIFEGFTAVKINNSGHIAGRIS